MKKTPATIDPTAPIKIYDAGHANLKLLIPFISRDATRIVMTKVCILEGHAYASDGHKLIRIPVSDFLLGGAPQPKDGVYDLLKAGAEVILRPNTEGLWAPNYLALVPNSLKDLDFKFKWSTGSTPKQNSTNLSELIYSLATAGICLNLANLEALPKGWEFEVSGVVNSFKPVIFKTTESRSSEALIIVMPFRADSAWRYSAETEDGKLIKDLGALAKACYNANHQTTQKDQLAAFKEAITTPTPVKHIIHRLEARKA